ncbi:MAG TPA: 7TM diverse intracellular signaling domain-containing protein [Bacteroidia bacterium]|nr:7TM diverse intracellular signaling domain-containing protein [Bacteroidia bacterium]
MKKKICFIFLIFLVFNASAISNDTIYLNQGVHKISSNSKENYFFTNQKLNLEEIVLQKFKHKNEINLGYISGFLWVKFVVKNNNPLIDRYVIHLSDGHVSGIYIFKPTVNGYQMSAAKQHHPEDGREIFNRIPAFFIDLKYGETKTFYLKIVSENEVVNFDYIIEDSVQYYETVQTDYFIIAIYWGALFLIIVINIFYFISLKDRLFLIYSFYVLSCFFLTATIDGFVWLLSPNPDIAYHLNFFFIRLWPDALLFFTIHLVNLKIYRKRLMIISYIFIFYHSIIMAALDLFNFFNIRGNLMEQWETINLGLCVILIFIVIVSSYKNNKYLFKYYLVAYGVLLFIFIFACLHTKSAENWLFFEHGMKAGTLIEIVTLSFAVSRRFKLTENDLKQKREEKEQLTDKVKQLEMNARKAQMNPHFMFNALSSIEYFIFKNNPDKARNYLGSFAELMRLTLNNSRIDYIPIADDLNALKFYIELEFLRFDAVPHHLEIKVDTNVDIHSILIPALLIQPFAENAILHGLQTKLIPGHLYINLYFEGNELHCIIEDDGGGIKKMHQPHRKSLGIQITKERLTLIHELLNTSYRFSIEDIKDDHQIVTGTRVDFNMPYVTENDY